MVLSWLSFGFFFMASLIHLGFAIYEFFYFSGSKESKVWAKNLAVYNLCLALTTIFGLQLIFEKKIMAAGYVVGLAGLTMFAASMALWITVPRLRLFAYLQGGPPVLGFIFLVLHVMERASELLKATEKF